MNNDSMKPGNKKTLTQQKQIKKMNTVKFIVLSLVVLGFLGFSVSNVSANELAQASISYGGKTQQLNDAIRKNIISQNSESTVYDQFIGKSQGKMRNVIIANKKNTTPKKVKGFNGVEKSFSSNNTRYYVPEFSIYDAITYLEDDIDGDGYYRTFGVIFDADVYNPNGNEDSVIYAELYLSTDGVNWEHYYTTDDFLIQGSNEDDQFEVITTFAEGYSPNYYDILIDIYEVGYADIVATHSSNDNNALYALPLESADYDEPYVEEVVIVHGGSTSLQFLLFVLLIGLVKTMRSKQK